MFNEKIIEEIEQKFPNGFILIVPSHDLEKEKEGILLITLPRLYQDHVGMNRILTYLLILWNYLKKIKGDSTDALSAQDF